MQVPEIKRLSCKPTYIKYGVCTTEYGDMMVGICDDAICWMGFDLDGSVMRKRFPNADFQKGNVSVKGAHLALYGTDFQIDVWKALLAISNDETITYGALAIKLGKPKAYRAVGTAVGMNPISGVIPCHRVLPVNGGVGSYLWGTEKKASLLNRSKGL